MPYKPVGADENNRFSPRIEARLAAEFGAVAATNPEVVRDTIASALVAGSGVTITVSDAADTITIAATGGGGGTVTDTEVVRDTIANALVAGAGISINVNDAADTITLIAAPVPVTTNVQTGTAYTLVLADAGRIIETTGSGAVTLTVPAATSAAFPVGTMIEIAQYGAGQITLAAATGVTLRTPSSLTTRARYSTVGLRLRATNEWIVSGDLS
jgi:hypothetical protein